MSPELFFSLFQASFSNSAELAANITADLAPSHIRKNAEYVGAFVYRFYSIDKLVSKLFEIDWIKTVGDNEKPAVCVVKN